MGCCVSLLTGKIVRKDEESVDKVPEDTKLRELIASNGWSFTKPKPEMKDYERRMVLWERFLGRQKDHGFKTGDLIVYNTYPGKSTIKNMFRNIAKVTTDTKYTHVGLVLVTPGGSRGEHREYIMEATTNPAETKDATSGSGTRRNGLWCFRLPERIMSDPAELWHIPVKERLEKKQENDLWEWASKAFWKDPIFDKDGMFAAGFDFFDAITGEEKDKSEHLVSLFCSEFVSACYKKAGLLKADFNPSEATPADVSEFEFLDQTKLFQLKGKNEFYYHENNSDVNAKG